MSKRKRWVDQVELARLMGKTTAELQENFVARGLMERVEVTESAERIGRFARPGVKRGKYVPTHHVNCFKLARMKPVKNRSWRDRTYLWDAGQFANEFAPSEATA